MQNNRQVGNYIFFEKFKKKIRLNIRIPGIELSQAWDKCSLIADFSSTYINSGSLSEKSISNSLSFILNELLENSIKYNYDDREPIEISILQNKSKIIAEVSNYINKEQYQKMSKEAKAIVLIKDDGKQYLEKLSLLPKNIKQSGIGLMTIINYFNAKLGFNFNKIDDKNNIYKLSVQIKADIKEL